MHTCGFCFVFGLFVFFVGGTQLTVHTIFSPDLTHSYVATTTQISYPPPKKQQLSSLPFLCIIMY